MIEQSHDHDRRLVAWLSLAQLISWGSLFYAFALLMEPVEQELGLSRVESSLAFSLALLIEGLVAYPVGRWIDQGHERVVMTVGSIAAAIGLAWHSQISSLAGFYAVWAWLGAAMAAILYAPVFSVVTRRFPRDFRRAIITLTFLGGLASTVFIPLTASLISGLGWRQALMWLALAHLVVCAPLHFYFLRDAPLAVKVEPTSGSALSNQLSHHVLSAPFLFIAVFIVLMMGVTVALPAHMISLLRENGLDEVWVIAIPASIGAVQVLGRVLLYFFERHLDLHLANRLIPCLIPLGLLALLAAPWMGRWHVAMVLLFVSLYGLGNGLLTIVNGTAMAQYVSRDHVASLNGALGVPLALARAAAPLLLGLLWSEQTGYTLGLWVLLGFSVLGTVAFVLAQRLSLRRA
jgi:MFS family permease